MQIGNLTLIIPVIYAIIAAIVVLILGVIAEKRPDKGLDHWLPAQYLAPALMVPGVILAGWTVAQSLILAGSPETASAVNLFVTAGGQAQLVVDPFAAIFSFVAFAGTLIVMLLSLDHFGERQIHKAEYYALLMFAASAASLAAAASDLIAIYLSIEFLSMTSYVLAAFAKTDRRSGEAGLKYFLYGAACSGIMIYGMSILFGVTGGSTSLGAIAAQFSGKVALSGAAFVGVMFTLVGLGFKIALVPFQFWAPDVYEGSPTPVTAFLSVVSKAAGLAVLVRFLIVVALPLSPADLSWYWVLAVLCALSMFYGNLVAIPQTNIKRMLAYSSIAQVGYMMIGVLAAMHVFTRNYVPEDAGSVRSTQPSWGMQGVVIYIIAYLLMNLGAFTVVVAVGKRLRSDAIASYAGLMRTSPFAACALTLFFASLAGIPPTVGFLGKFFIFAGAIRAGLAGSPELIALAIIGVTNSVISVFYYFNVVRLMFFTEPASDKPIRFSFAMNAVVAVTLALTVGLIAFAKPLSELTMAVICGCIPSG